MSRKVKGLMAAPIPFLPRYYNTRPNPSEFNSGDKISFFNDKGIRAQLHIRACKQCGVKRWVSYSLSRKVKLCKDCFLEVEDDATSINN